MLTSNRHIPIGHLSLFGMAVLLAITILLLGSIPRQAAGTSADTFTNYLPLILNRWPISRAW